MTASAQLSLPKPPFTASAYAAIAVAQQLACSGKSIAVGGAAGDLALTVDGTRVATDTHIPRYLAGLYLDTALYGANPVEMAQVDVWLDLAHDQLASGSDYKQLSVVLARLDAHLKMRTFLVNYRLTLADIVVWACVRASPIWTRMLKANKGDSLTYLTRWYNHMLALDFAQATVDIVNKAVLADREASKTKGPGPTQGNYEIGLEGAVEGKVVTRFPPEASGYLHIGHTKAALLNEYFARAYKGKLIVRFDDTNPSKEKQEYEDAIIEDLERIGVKGDIMTWTSDHFPKLYELAVSMIKKGLAYVDDTAQEQMRKERMDGIASKNRDLSVEENLKRFKEMENGTEFGLTCCLRAKMSVDNKNKAMRDPVIYRCNLLPHSRTGDKWKIYPTYDFACPIVDSTEGVTHALRTTEYHDRNAQYEWFLEKLGLRKVSIWDYSRMNFVYTLLSKRKLAWFVEKKLVTGWDDPRFPTVRGVLRRGLTVATLKKYVLLQGPSRNNMLLEWDKLWSMNKQEIDQVAPRFVGLAKEGLRQVLLVDAPAAPYEKQMPKHKKNPAVGMKTTTFTKTIHIEGEDAKDLTVGEEITMMDFGNIIITKVPASADAPIEATLNLAGDFKKTKKKLTWLPDLGAKLVPLKLRDYDFLITKKKLEEEDTFEDCLNEKTEFLTEAVGDANLVTVKKGEIIQLERRGYFICDEPRTAAHPWLELFAIPDGRAASVSLKSAAPTTGR